MSFAITRWPGYREDTLNIFVWTDGEPKKIIQEYAKGQGLTLTGPLSWSTYMQCFEVHKELAKELLMVLEANGEMAGSFSHSGPGIVNYPPHENVWLALWQ